MSATHEVAEDLCVVHTSHPILSAENLVDFQRFMGELDRAGRESHFWQMWGAVWEVCHLPVPDEVLTHLSLSGRQVPGSTKCSPPVDAGSKVSSFWKDPLVDVPEAEAVFLDPVDPSQRALAAWVLHVAAAPPEVAMPHACVFCGCL
eukprot:s9076_g1.t1